VLPLIDRVEFLTVKIKFRVHYYTETFSYHINAYLGPTASDERLNYKT